MSAPEIRKPVPQDAETFVAPTRPDLRLVPSPIPETVTDSPPVAPPERPSTLVFDITGTGGTIFLNPELDIFQGLRGEVTLEPGQLVELGKVIKAHKKELKSAAKALRKQREKDPNLGLPDRAKPPIIAGRATIAITAEEYSQKLSTGKDEVKRPPQPPTENYASK